MDDRQSRAVPAARTIVSGLDRFDRAGQEHRQEQG